MVLMDALFWWAAILQVAVAVRFSILSYGLRPERRQPRNAILVRGQMKDELLSAAVMMAISLSKGLPVTNEVLEVTGVFVFLWLVRRTAHRVRVLRRP